jgi:hypothetical protein
MPFREKKEKFNPYNPDSAFDEDWEEANSSPGFTVSRFQAAGMELLPHASKAVHLSSSG